MEVRFKEFEKLTHIKQHYAIKLHWSRLTKMDGYFLLDVKKSRPKAALSLQIEL